MNKIKGQSDDSQGIVVRHSRNRKTFFGLLSTTAIGAIALLVFLPASEVYASNLVKEIYRSNEDYYADEFGAPTELCGYVQGQLFSADVNTKFYHLVTYSDGSSEANALFDVTLYIDGTSVASYQDRYSSTSDGQTTHTEDDLRVTCADATKERHSVTYDY